MQNVSHDLQIHLIVLVSACTGCDNIRFGDEQKCMCMATGFQNKVFLFGDKQICDNRINRETCFHLGTK